MYFYYITFWRMEIWIPLVNLILMALFIIGSDQITNNAMWYKCLKKSPQWRLIAEHLIKQKNTAKILVLGLNTATPSTTANNQSASTGGAASNTTATTCSAMLGTTDANSQQSSFQCRAIVETTTTMTRVTTTAAEASDPLEDSSESETDNNDETGTTDKFLPLIGNIIHMSL